MRGHFGQQLRLAREARSYTQKALGQLIGLDANTVARVERGEQGMRWTNLEKLIDVLGEPASYYFSNARPVQAEKVPPTVEALTKVIEAQERRIRELDSAAPKWMAAEQPDLSRIPRDLLARLAAANEDELADIELIFQSHDETDGELEPEVRESQRKDRKKR